MARVPEVRVCRGDVMRVLYAPPGPFFARRSLVTVPDACTKTAFDVHTANGWVAVSAPRLTARVSADTGQVVFLDAAGRTLLAEKKGGGKSLTAAEVMGEKTVHVQAESEPAEGEALYGLGAHQNALMDRPVPVRYISAASAFSSPRSIAASACRLVWSRPAVTTASTRPAFR